MTKIVSVHVLGKLDRGGAETWLKDLCLNSEESNLQIDFLLTRTGEGAYDEVVKQAGSKIYYNELGSINIIKFCINLYLFLKRKKINNIHSHVHYFSGLILFIAFLAGVKTRIVHSHLDTSSDDLHQKGLRNLYLNLMRYLINKFSTKNVACSPEAGRALFLNNDYKIIKLGIDIERFSSDSELKKKEFYCQHNIPEHATIIGHVGRFSNQKNHKFLIDIFKEVYKVSSNYFLVLVGGGELEEVVRKQISDYKLEDNVRLIGLRDDIPFLLKDVFSIFIMPSLYEGSPVVLLEAQAAGLNCIISNKISVADREIPELFTTLSLEEPSAWVEAVIASKPNETSFRKQCLVRVIESEYNIKSSLASLTNLYSEN
ncbi:glycosyltransferase [Pontibacter sp. BT310]|uniref:Glycosyltransferase n=1 Tax=Pontibacter populi TaxID=890055 RepID=A0ABS6XDI9_9BACT|nr:MULTISPECIES: glycosyltransferase [Pontibacter]MBJ6119203.1 glycosyltransferase [Pontibacter sp. BT310]MBR0571631.1 glycosyltransferase [Microvirga sp. STS03]MBW3366057.1 glycosyltransferase [Pontibacter populi]